MGPGTRSGGASLLPFGFIRVIFLALALLAGTNERNNPLHFRSGMPGRQKKPDQLNQGLQYLKTNAIALWPAGAPSEPVIVTRHDGSMLAWKLPVLLPVLFAPMMLDADTAASTAEGDRPARQAGWGTVAPCW